MVLLKAISDEKNFLMSIIGMFSIAGCDIESKNSAINYNDERVVKIDFSDIKKSASLQDPTAP